MSLEEGGLFGLGRLLDKAGALIQCVGQGMAAGWQDTILVQPHLLVRDALIDLQAHLQFVIRANGWHQDANFQAQVERRSILLWKHYGPPEEPEVASPVEGDCSEPSEPE